MKTPFDCFAISEQGPNIDGNDDRVIVDALNGIFIVADGMGGRPGGSKASKIAVQVLRDELLHLDPPARLDEGKLRQAVATANDAVRAVSLADSTLTGMGTTLSAAVIVGPEGKIVHIGDSRIYQLSAGRLKTLTQDHTLVAELLARQHLSPEEAKRFSLRHVLARAIGSQAEAEPDIAELGLPQGDWLLLATDGFYQALPEQRMEVIIEATEDRGAKAVCHALMDAAINANPRDNLTLAMVRRLRPPEQTQNL